MPTRHRSGRLLAALAAVLAGAFTVAVALPAEASAPVMPKSWILVDQDTGRVLDAHDEHTLRRPASTIKLLTVLTAMQHLSPKAQVPVSELAAGMPARKMGFEAGTTWSLSQMLASAVIVSANDAAVALGEASGGSLDGFADQMRAAARTLGVVDSPVLDDPSGLDDEFRHGRGDLISAWDLAVIGRAAFREPTIRQLAADPLVRFTDSEGRPHRLVNHNRLLTDYVGGNGLKPGYTKAAGNTFVGTATRDGRTMLVVVLDAPDLYTPMKALFDKGFAIEPGFESGPVLAVHSLARSSANEVVRAGGAMPAAAAAKSTSPLREVSQWLALGTGAATLALVELRRRRRTVRR
jgi:D-alanyl-D-alanine carboxypeptidase (penicillin-binding protein 5/6)